MYLYLIFVYKSRDYNITVRLLILSLMYSNRMARDVDYKVPSINFNIL